MRGKRLYRSTKNKVLCGLCGGVGEYFNIDPVIIRLIWMVLLLIRSGRHLMYSVFGLSAFGVSLILYILAAVIIPKNPGFGAE